MRQRRRRGLSYDPRDQAHRALGIVVVALVLFVAASSDGRGALGQLGRRLFGLPVEPLASVEERIATRERLDDQYRWLIGTEGDAAAFLFGEAKAAFEATRDGIKSLDTKASTLIGIVTTGLGAVALLGDASKLPAKSPYLFLGLALLAVALFAAVLALPARGLPVPSLSEYALLSTLAVTDNQARIQFELIEAWLDDTHRAEAIAGGKARLLLIAALAIVLGAVSSTVNWVSGVTLPAAPVAQPPPGVQRSAPPPPPSRHEERHEQPHAAAG
jgi:hypothetical protein